MIPQGQRIKHRLQDLEDAFIKLVEYRKGLFERSRRAREDFQNLVEQYGGGEAWENVNNYWMGLKECRDLAVDVVHLDNTQLHHPVVQWLLESTPSKDFLRELHRGLETGVKRGIESVKGVVGENEEEKFANAIMVTNIVKKDRKMLPWNSTQPKSYVQIQRHLERTIFDKQGQVVRGPFIKKMSRQNFHKMVKRLLTLLSRPNPSYNSHALPLRAKKIPSEWAGAQKLVRELKAVEGRWRETIPYW